MGFFLKFLFYAIIVLTVLRFVMARVFPWLLRKFVLKMQKRAFGEYQNSGRQDRSKTNRKADGKVQIDYIPPQSNPNKGASKAGEFVDFEEIK